MDALSEVIEISRVGGVVLANMRARAPWALGLPQMRGAAFHAVAGGTCWLGVDGDPPRQLMPGDVVLVPTGGPHRLGSAPDVPVRPYEVLREQRAIDPDGNLDLPGPGACTRMICANFEYDHAVAHHLLALLPAVVVVEAGGPHGEAVQATLRLLALELDQRSPGSQPVIDRLVDVLFVQVIRAWARQDGAAASWLRGLRDPLVAQALALLHSRPAQPWTVEALARAVNVSRATLARRFTELVGQSPLSYLTHWRMDLAARRLRETADSIEAVALGVGYSSEHTFSRAFLRHWGVRPGRYRTEAAAA